MQLTCPNCGKPISAENINIQRMAAVCSACHTVFQFDPTSTSKSKRRKVKQPEHLTLDHTDDRLSMAFRTNFRLDKNMTFLSIAGFSIFFTFLVAIISQKGSTNPESVLLLQGFQLLLTFLYYWLALMLWNKTHIEISDTEIKVSRKPLPNFLTQPNKINVSGIERIRYEETPTSKKEAFDTPRFNVWAETEGGSRRLIVGDLVEDYAVFIVQQLNEFLEPDTAEDAARLLDDNREDEDVQEVDEVIAHSESSHN